MMEMDARGGGVCETAADAAPECSVAQAIQLISRCAQATPLRTVHSEAGPGLAMWRFMPGRIALDPLPCNVLSYLRHGTPTITRITGGTLRAQAPAHRRGDLSPAGRRVGMAAGRYRDLPARLHSRQRARDRRLFRHRGCVARDVFPDAGERVRHVFSAAGAGRLASVDETQRSLLRHLARWHSAAAAAKPGARAPAGKVSPLRPSMLQRISDFIDANLAADISLRALAELCAMSVEHFLRSFRAATGKTPYQYVLELRLAKAALLLKSDPAPVSAIAPECGFRNLSHFSLRFRAHFGTSPSQFRRELSAR